EQPMFGLITRKKHEAALALMAKANVDLEEKVAGQTAACRSLARRMNVALIERDRAAAELAVWRQYGQLRDPKTGRLIPKSAVA
ncbi:hypothetical protein K7W03_27465, partial [Sphingobium sp. PNB]|uniref:hypothetical protein n=1 Tax=Sphingobium sp. PNB TaxID=863934 RepID=UPI001CA3F8A3